MIIQSEEEIKKRKQLRKEQKKASKSHQRDQGKLYEIYLDSIYYRLLFIFTSFNF